MIQGQYNDFANAFDWSIFSEIFTQMYNTYMINKTFLTFNNNK